MKLKFFTIEIDDKCFDLPKDMPIPQKGDTIFIEGKVGKVKKKYVHIIDGKVFAISLFTYKA